LIGQNMVDVGRALDPDNNELFTWWAPWRNLRQRNIGWRIDYVLASAPLAATASAFSVSRHGDHGPVVPIFGGWPNGGSSAGAGGLDRQVQQETSPIRGAIERSDRHFRPKQHGRRGHGVLSPSQCRRGSVDLGSASEEQLLAIATPSWIATPSARHAFTCAGLRGAVLDSLHVDVELPGLIRGVRDPPSVRRHHTTHIREARHDRSRRSASAERTSTGPRACRACSRHHQIRAVGRPLAEADALVKVCQDPAGNTAPVPRSSCAPPVLARDRPATCVDSSVSIDSDMEASGCAHQRDDVQGSEQRVEHRCGDLLPVRASRPVPAGAPTA
jgi:hypothetical protein